MNDVPLDLYIAGYSDPAAAKEDFDALEEGAASRKVPAPTRTDGQDQRERHSRRCLAARAQEEPMNDAPLDLYIAGYTDPTAAKADFDALKKAQRQRHRLHRRHGAGEP